jgi:hypothetical protein
LRALAEQLEDTQIVAAAEIATQANRTHVKSDVENIGFGSDYFRFGRHQRA